MIVRERRLTAFGEPKHKPECIGQFEGVRWPVNHRWASSIEEVKMASADKGPLRSLPTKKPVLSAAISADVSERSELARWSRLKRASWSTWCSENRAWLNREGLTVLWYHLQVQITTRVKLAAKEPEGKWGPPFVFRIKPPSSKRTSMALQKIQKQASRSFLWRRRTQSVDIAKVVNRAAAN